jgi:soluble epoxide hydrolase / lipid-phosphate phosphatase
VSPDGAAKVDRTSHVFDSLMYAADPLAWREHLGEEGKLEKLLDSGELLPIGKYVSPEEVTMHNKIIAMKGYDGVFNW